MRSVEKKCRFLVCESPSIVFINIFYQKFKFKTLSMSYIRFLYSDKGDERTNY